MLLRSPPPKFTPAVVIKWLTCFHWHMNKHFFTSGYKMCLVIYANGNGGIKGTHISVYLQILHGPHDDQLDWPLSLNYWTSLRNDLDLPDDEEYNKPGGNGWGYPIFIKKSELNFNSSKNAQYLKDDKLYIRVTSKMPSSHKPWLEYTQCIVKLDAR